MVRSRQALKGWRKLAPPTSRMAVPYEIVAMIVNFLLFKGFRQAALIILLVFELYCRPGEPLLLTALELVPPMARSFGESYWSLVLHPWEGQEPSKTSEFDETLELDLPRQKNLGPALEDMMDQRLGSDWRKRLRHLQSQGGRQAVPKLFDLTYPQLQSAWKLAIKHFSLPKIGIHMMYQLRHGGASHDSVAKTRPLDEIRKRGRWKSWGSVRRYEKGARSGEMLQRLCPTVKDHALCCAASLGDVLAGSKSPLRPL